MPQDDGTLRELWRFRLTHMALKPGVDPDEDFRTFASDIRRGVRSWVLRDHSRAVRGMGHFIATRREHAGRPYVYLQPEYIYIDPAHRKGLGLARAAAHALALCLRHWPGLPIYAGGPGYPGGYITLCQITEPVWLWNDPTMTPWESGAFASIASEHPGWDPATGVVTMKTRPLRPRTTPPRDARLRAYTDRYTALCPRWTEGYTAFCLGRLSWVSLAVTTRSLLKRLR